MVVVCAVADCQNRAEKNQVPNSSFFPFPLDELLLGQWLCFCAQKDGVNTKTAKVCSLHFKKDDFENFMKYEYGYAKKLKLNKDAVPTVQVKKAEDKCPPDIRLQLDKLTNEVDDMREKKLEIDKVTKDLDDMKNIIADLQRENFILKNAEYDFKKEINSLRLELAKSQSIRNRFDENLRKVFSPGQMRQLQNEKRVIWSEEDITRAIVLYSTSHRAYELLRKMQLPFPAVRTLLAHQKKEKDKIAETEEINDDNIDI